MFQVLFILQFPCSLSSGVCLPSVQEWKNSLRALSKASQLTFKMAIFKPCWLPELKNISPSHLLSQWLWGIVLLIHSPVGPSLSTPPQLSSSPWLPPICSNSHLVFPHKPCLHTSFLPQCGLFSPFSCGVCFFSLQINCGIFRMI